MQSVIDINWCFTFERLFIVLVLSDISILLCNAHHSSAFVCTSIVHNLCIILSFHSSQKPALPNSTFDICGIRWYLKQSRLALNVDYRPPNIISKTPDMIRASGNVMPWVIDPRINPGRSRIRQSNLLWGKINATFTKWWNILQHLKATGLHIEI